MRGSIRFLISSVCAAIVVYGCSGGSSPEAGGTGDGSINTSHDAVAKEFGNDVLKGDWGAAYSLTAPEFQATTSQADLQKQFDDVEAEFVKDDPNFKPSTVQVDHGSLPSNEDEAQRLYHWKVVPPKDTWRAWSFVLIGVGSADEFASGPEAQVLIVDVNGQDRLGHVEFVRP